MTAKTRRAATAKTLRTATAETKRAALVYAAVLAGIVAPEVALPVALVWVEVRALIELQRAIRDLTKIARRRKRAAQAVAA